MEPSNKSTHRTQDQLWAAGGGALNLSLSVWEREHTWAWPPTEKRVCELQSKAASSWDFLPYGLSLSLAPLSISCGVACYYPTETHVSLTVPNLLCSGREP